MKRLRNKNKKPRSAIEKGTWVRMTQDLKDGMRANGSHEHVDEFGDCIGMVIGPMFPDCEDAPEVDVRWQPSNLRYGYHPDHLEIVKE